ncbi:hypothetical protein [Streptomyces silvisoli]|uniref:Uncharacterized protein n=1 Tax=Streptomyces silvisoli TaxID=3034235 RepID=A0ABT5ZLN2_9ACTN|nr:hypothetical protein [Streptomyces silvisoli]MDF3290707.1 hypothetical protein [Streptomyces silvisoli]
MTDTKTGDDETVMCLRQPVEKRTIIVARDAVEGHTCRIEPRHIGLDRQQLAAGRPGQYAYLTFDDVTDRTNVRGGERCSTRAVGLVYPTCGMYLVVENDQRPELTG